MKRISTISKIMLGILVISLLFEMVPIQGRLIAKAAGSYNGLAACDSSYKKIHGDRLPPNEIKCVKRESDGQYIMFNWSLYEGLKVISYGKVESANTKPNDFKSGWRDLQNVNREDYDGTHPYFTKNGARGEYRYLGWDVNGRRYSNVYFIPDEDLGIDPDQKKWIYRPWDSPLAQKSSRAPSGFSPIFIDEAKYQSPWHIIFNNLEDEVNNLLHAPNVTVKYQALPDYAVDKASPKNIFEYMYVEQVPTSQVAGSGTMFHRSTSNNKIYYQTFYLKPLDSSQKEKPGVTARITEQPTIKSTNLKTLPEEFVLNWKLEGEIKDDNYFTSDYNSVKYYTRADIAEWRLEVTYSWPGGSKKEVLSSLISGELALQNKRKIASRTPELSIKFDKSKLKKGDKVEIKLTAKAYYYTPDNSVVFDSHSTTYTKTFDGNPPPPPPTKPTPTPTPPASGGGTTPEPTTPPLVCRFNIPDDAFDIVPFEGVSDSTDMSRVTIREVTVDGVPVDPDEFWSGNYVFGDEADGLRTVAVKWVPADVDPDWTEMCDTYRIVNVHDTKPRAQFKLYGGSFKENRKMSIENTSYDPNANDPFVQAAYPIVDAKWTWTAIDGSDSDREMRTDSKDTKVFLYKNAGEYQVALTVTNALGRTSDPYVLPFSVLEDFDPAVIMHPYSSEIARDEPLSLMYDGVSTDGDTITKHEIKVYYDEKGDGTYSKLIDTFNAPISEYIPSISALGSYRIVSTVEEEFGQETLSEFITAADKRSSTKQFEFVIDNYIPYSDISTDIPSIRQEVDVALLLDKNLDRPKSDYVTSNGITINNQFRYEGIDPNISTWNMHTYTYSQPASTSSSTGTSFPSSSVSYCSEGYCGTLSRYDYSDNGSYHDYGSMQRVVDVPEHTIPWCYYEAQNGQTYSHAPPCDSNSNATTKTIPATYKDVWVPDVRWVSNYYGYYSGTIYKYVRQPFTNPYVRTTADRFLVYISDNTINELSDFNKVKGLSDAKIILVGSEDIKALTNYDHYISSSGKTIEEVMSAVVEYIASHNPPAASQTVLVNEAFNLITDESDPENDRIIEREVMYVHDPNYFDNPTGAESFTLKAYDPAGWTPEVLKTRFSHTGEYKIYRRIKDQPSTDSMLQKYNYWSNEALTIIKVHRKPIAKAELDWSYDPSCNCYNTTWVDQSYDLDHNVSDPVNKGIVERKIKYTIGGEAYYQIPDKLAAGDYRLEYIVRDVEGVWSDPFVLNFSLSSVPPVQLKGKLKSKLPVFSTNSIPASEELTVYDIWTRYPYSTSLELNITNPAGTSNYSTVKRVDYYTGTKTGNDIFWSDENLMIPETLADGTYAVKLKANGLSSQANAQILLPFTVFTPINLSGQIDAATGGGINLATLLTGDTYQLKARTTKYPNTTTVIAFKGSSYQRSITLTSATSNTAGIGQKDWINAAAFTVPKIPDGRYTFEWSSRAPNGKVETVSKLIEIVNNRPPTADFTWSPQPVYEGDTVSFASNIQDLDGDTLSVVYELISPSGVSNRTTYSLQPPYAHTGPAQRLTQLGNWRMRLSVSDGKAPPVLVEKAVPVRALHVSGQVLHTELWNEHRQEYNRKKSGNAESPRGYSVFWAGEKFVLSADTTVTGTPTRASRVEAAFGEYSVVLSAKDASKTIWGGEMWDEEFESSLQDGPATFTFTAYYSNGTVKSTNVTIEIRGGVSQILGVHRVQ